MPTPGNITAFPALGKKTSVFHNILTVCTGNICRSPVAEYLLRHEIALAGRKADVRSAGIGALVDHPADDTALLVMDELGVPMQAHRARQIKVEHTRWADLILVMQSHHLEYVLSLDPTARGKTFLMGRWNKREIPDPYRQGDASHRAAYALIHADAAAWLARF
ncbi:low molecular weight phosphotyrosine protein phosphatase [Zoogloea oleivorans]|jgi:protein-tyrosine phosphatase|uniref:protein-tyrosine-phosphatase n=1 Tax=Zoogloea oleivorans TaxID=1552750 RepID=A0A6C2CEG8_9RHOO|nr:low molecular weight protein-tyrosine-phosphatase [Zoogloea oleivorans]TYC51823.1 low molecular weight phosphotyrosine protein phosphatase [Zoogloea oleivorans]